MKNRKEDNALQISYNFPLGSINNCKCSFYALHMVKLKITY
jgi:hypothetical protein